jgi:hypothetical protein
MESPQNINIGPFWFVVAVLGVGANFAGGCIWFGLGPALFITGALAVVLSWGSGALSLSLLVLWSAATNRGAARR